MQSENTYQLSDTIVILGIIALTVLYSLIFLDFSSHPLEDAAILLRYSEHLAAGQGIVWNAAESPVDGATDFLYMMLLARLAKVGLSLETGARVVGFASHIVTVLIIYLALRKLQGSARWVAGISAACLAFGPGLWYTVACFGTPLYALFVCITWCFAFRMAKHSDSRTVPLLFALSGLVTGLLRPEGVFLAVLMLLAIVYFRGLKRSRPVLLYFALVFLVLGGLYFFWRWHYFGHPFPNPFYRKGGGHLYWVGLRSSVRASAILAGPVLLLLLLGLGFRQTVRQAVFSLIPVGGFVALWVLVDDAMNYLGRFQYPILPVALMSWPWIISGVWEELKLPNLRDLPRRSRVGMVALSVIVCVGIASFQYKLFERDQRAEGWVAANNFAVGSMLGEYRHRGYTLATTEAGVLPLYSHWRTIDTWGLNDPWIVHNGGITEAYLARCKPEVIMFHASFSPIVPQQKVAWFGVGWLDEAWYSMVATLKNYAEKNKYVLVADFGESPYDTHYYYVRSDFAESAEIARKIRSMNLVCGQYGQKCINYAMVQTLNSK
jgi:arabinofuranosyltransferase